ncbi:MAG: flagellar assembly protein FliW [Candidatus Methylomirabilia bacterium]
MSRQRTLRSPKLGPVSFRTDDVIHFPEGIPGFETLNKFLLVTRTECEPFIFLTSLERPEIALPLLPPTLVQPGWAPPFAPSGPGDLAWYAVVIIAPNATAIMPNLRAPILIDLRDRIGRQVLLDDDNAPLGVPFHAAGLG